MLGFEMTEPMLNFFLLQIVTILGMMGKGIYDMVKMRSDAAKAKTLREQDRLDREQDRLDRIQLASLTLSQLEDVKTAGNDRLITLVDEVQKVKQVAVASMRASNLAIKVSNGHNEKIQAAVQLGNSILETVSKPQQVEVVNSPSNPVPVEESHPAP